MFHTNRVARYGLFVIAVLGGNRANAEFVPQLYEARRADNPPAIDGSLDEPIWDTAHEIADFFAYQSGGEVAAAETSAKILWDDQSLYLAFEMMDVDIRPSSVTANQTGRDAQLFRGDVIEFFVREDRDSPRYFEFEWSPNGKDVFDARFDERRFGPPGTDWNTELTWAVSVDGTIDEFSDQDVGWTVEAAIPLSAFDSISTGSEWTFTVARYDYFNPISEVEQLMMSTPGDPELPLAGLTSGFHTYELYDDLKFVPEPTSFGLLVPIVIFARLRRRTGEWHGQ